MKNKILLSTLIASTFLISSQADAAQSTGTANFNLVYPISVTETAIMEFGDVSILADGTCTLGYADDATGAACVAGGNAALSGEFTIAADNTNVNITLSAADSASVTGVTFTPTITAGTLAVTGNSAVIKVGGTLDIVAANAVSGAQNITYTIDVTY
jgi:transketolase C-terminal domain/subunit